MLAIANESMAVDNKAWGVVASILAAEEALELDRLAAHVACDREKALHIMGVVPEAQEKSPTKAKFWAAYCTICKDGLEGGNHTKESADSYVKTHDALHSKEKVQPAPGTVSSGTLGNGPMRIIPGKLERRATGDWEATGWTIENGTFADLQKAIVEEIARRKLGLRSARFINQPEWNSDYD